MNGDRQLRHSEIREFFDRIAPERENWIGKNAYFYESDAAYMRFSVPEGLSVLEVGCGTGHLLALLKPSRGVGVDISPAMLEHARAKHPELEFVCGDIEDEDLQARLKGPFDVIVMSDLVGYLDDCQALFSALRRLLAPRGRIVIVYYNRWWQPLLRAGEKIGLKMPSLAQNWLTTDDLANLLDLAGLQPIRREWRMLLPRRLLGLGVLVNRLIAPLPFIRRMCVRNFVVARSRPEVVHPPSEPSVSVLIPCRNERGNIEAAVRRLPRFAPDMEVIFAEGNSSDGTFEECERVRDTNREWDIKVIKQPGKGKGDAVRAGFAVARGSILMILDCDLSVPPEALPKFYDVLRQGQGEYAHGTRLIYKMEKAAMRPLNFVANRGFAMILGYLINQRVTDTLCGTKVLWRIDYDRVVPTARISVSSIHSAISICFWRGKARTEDCRSSRAICQPNLRRDPNLTFFGRFLAAVDGRFCMAQVQGPLMRLDERPIDFDGSESRSLFSARAIKGIEVGSRPGNCGIIALWLRR